MDEFNVELDGDDGPYNVLIVGRFDDVDDFFDVDHAWNEAGEDIYVRLPQKDCDYIEERAQEHRKGNDRERLAQLAEDMWRDRRGY